MSPNTLMRKEILDIPDATTTLLTKGRADLESVASDLRSLSPAFLTTGARGSSDHAALFFKYASELTLGLPVASIGPSVVSIYPNSLSLKQSAGIIISQSGMSPDIIKLAQLAREQGTMSVAITNESSSPLAMASSHCVAINAGIESSVAATKTFVLSALAGLAILAFWKKDEALIAAIDKLPSYFEQAAQLDWSKLANALSDKDALYVLGRGPSLAISNEVALKFKETCQLHAESYSSAEVMHGPVSIVKPGYPVLVIAAEDAAETSIISVADQLALQGADVFVTSNKTKQANSLDAVRTGHPLTDPLTLIVSFYAFVEQFALQRGANPDAPPNLNKVTETV
jgi:glucosamine--fructose-6-phosphate aminotransferase (isomerizing)